MDFQEGTALAPPTDELIRWFETTYRVKLPVDYLGTLKGGNGAIPIRREFRHGLRVRMIERMLCLIPEPHDDRVNGWYDLTVVLSQLDARLIDDEKLVGMNVIPIAALFAGDFLCFDFRRTPESPVIAVWDHEQSRDLHPVLEPVAASFTAFDNLLN
jgi:hypothetical protein